MFRQEDRSLPLEKGKEGTTGHCMAHADRGGRAHCCLSRVLSKCPRSFQEYGELDVLGGAGLEAFLTQLPALQEGGALSHERLCRTMSPVLPCSAGTGTSPGPPRAQAAAMEPVRCIFGSALL